MENPIYEIVFRLIFQCFNSRRFKKTLNISDKKKSLAIAAFALTIRSKVKLKSIPDK